MGIEQAQRWQVSTTEAIEIQRQPAKQVSYQNTVSIPYNITGSDISVPLGGGVTTTAVVILKYPELEIDDWQIVNGELNFRYIPRMLSFREAPLLLTAFAGLPRSPDLILVNVQVISHPRRLCIVAYLGLLLNILTIDCAKSLLWRHYQEHVIGPCDFSWILDNGEIIEAVLYTKQQTKPIYVSVGHKVGLNIAIRWVLQCCHSFHLFEPTRGGKIVLKEKQ
jgi:deoxyribonuclease V